MMIVALIGGENCSSDVVLADFFGNPHRIWQTPARMGVTPQQFQQMKERLSGRTSRAEGILPAPSPALPQQRIVLGIDPSLRGTGFGVVRVEKTGPVALAQGTICCPSAWQRSRCLVKISDTLRAVLREHQPSVCAIEGLFYAQNLQTALIMGEARGAALAAVAEAGIDIYEIAPRKVKQALVGYGAAQKLAVARMVQRILQLSELPAPDAADALALALAFAQTTSRLAVSMPKKI